MVFRFMLLLCVVVPSHAGEDASTFFKELESKLLAAKTVRFNATAISEGAFAFSFNTEIVLAQGNRARLNAEGSMMKQARSPQLTSDGHQMVFGLAETNRKETTPGALNEGLLIGLTRMGIMHNLAMLSGGKAPDGTDGKAKEWVTLTDIRLKKGVSLDGKQTNQVTFGITVGGVPSATAVLWLSLDHGLPLRREQTVAFDGGSMTVIETYSNFVLNDPVAENAFDLPPVKNAATGQEKK